MNTKKDSSEEEKKYTNELINENSPYLLQHAHNPVNWLPWGDAAFKKAKEENKPLLISIGYAACHWCHVMEKECFEDTTVANRMNENFVCIKVDREERPDIDQVYMNAVQLMTGRGGWPLNCFATPDGRPFYGGTYFPKDKWMKILHQLSNIYQNEPEKIEEYANKLTEGVQNSELIKFQKSSDGLHIDSIQEALTKWMTAFDTVYGGNNQAPKFPMPNTYEFLLQYQYLYPNETIAKHIKTSLKKMAFGGIYDQVGGGFARYSTDMKWKVPHFEKMLYDNAQLISLYSKAYRWNKNPLYKSIVNQTIAFANRELKSPKNAYYSSLDADSEGEEGKYYVWTEKELKALLGNDFLLAKDYFNVNSNGLWEGNYILLREKDDQELAAEVNMTLADFHKKIEEIKSTLLQAREKRIKPALDDKTITSWNSLMIKGLCDAYLSFGNPEYLEMAKKNADFIINKQLRNDGGLNHTFRNGKSSINGYLEDYSFTIEAFVALYEVSFDEKWLDFAEQLAQYSIQHFFDKKSGMFYFTSDEDPQLITRKMEVMDNVIPSSNSSMAKGLYQLGLLLENQDYIDKNKQMLLNMQSQMSRYLPNTTNWGGLLLSNTSPFYELAIVGKNAQEQLLEISQHYLPNKLIIGQQHKNSTLPLLEMKWIEGQTTLYVCENKVCQAPVTEVEKAVEQMKAIK